MACAVCARKTQLMEIPGNILRPKIVGVPIVSRVFARTDAEAAAGLFAALSDQPPRLAEHALPLATARFAYPPGTPSQPAAGVGRGCHFHLRWLLLLLLLLVSRSARRN